MNNRLDNSSASRQTNSADGWPLSSPLAKPSQPLTTIDIIDIPLESYDEESMPAHSPSDDTSLSRADCAELDTSISHRELDQDATPPLVPSPSKTRPAASPIQLQIPGFQVERVLGQGGMGVVYLARQMRLDRLVALKTVRGDVDQAARSRFDREAKAIAAISHPNVVPIFEVGEHEGRPYLAMEYLPEGNLEHRYRDNLPGFEEAADLVKSLARAVHALHKAGVVHRDLKPANVLLTRDGSVKVSDLGLAKLVKDDEAQLTPTEAVLGTPSYMAPEQANPGDETTPRADIYALGAVLYRLLTGRPPFLADTIVDTILQARSEEPLPPRNLRPNLPHDLETICLKCLSKEKLQRYASAEELADDLQRYLNCEPIVARRISSIGRAVKWVRRRPALATLLFGSATALSLIIGILLASRFLLLKEQRQTHEFAAVAVEASRDLARFGAEELLYVSAADETRHRMVQRALQANERMVELRGEQPQFRLETALTHISSGQMSHSIGDSSKAKTSFALAVGLLEELSEETPTHSYLNAQAEVSRSLGAVSLQLGEYDSAESWFQQSRAALQQTPNSETRALLTVNVLESQASVYFQTGRLRLGGERLKEAEKLLLDVAASGSRESRLASVRLASDLAEYHYMQGNWQHARRLLDGIHDQFDRLFENPPTRADKMAIYGKLLFQRSLVTTAANGDMTPDLSRGLALLEKLVDHYPRFNNFRVDLARCFYSAAMVLPSVGEGARAQKYLKQVIALADETPHVPELKLLAIASHLNIGLAYAPQPPAGMTMAGGHWNTGRTKWETLPAEVRASYLGQLLLSRSKTYLSQIQLSAGNTDSALRLLDEARTIQQRLLRKTSAPGIQRIHAWTEAYLGAIKSCQAETLPDAIAHFQAVRSTTKALISSRYAVLRWGTAELLKLSAKSAYGTGNALAFQNKHAEASLQLELAIADAQQGQKFRPNDADFQQLLVYSRQAMFQVQRNLENHKAMIAILRDSPIPDKPTVSAALDVARAIMQAIAIAENDRLLPEEESASMRREYVAYAIDMLDQAVQQGVPVAQLEKGAEWEVLRRYPLFDVFLAKLRKQRRLIAGIAS